jgi:hypothetical protein
MRGGTLRATIVIPCYWSRSSSEPFSPDDAVYDHPTPLDLDGTLHRALESITVLENRDFNVVVLACASADNIAEQAEQKAQGIVKQFKSYFPVTVVSHSFETRIKERIDVERKVNAKLDPSLVSLRGYSNIRNMCQIVTELARSEVAVLFDDDQVYEDRQYLDKVFENIGKEHEGRFVGAIAGYYQRPDGSYLLPPPSDWWMSEWPMVSSMNAAFGIIGEPPRLKKTPFVFGGNMVLHRDVFRKMAFDPNVRRGEDIDYLFNCKFYDIDFLLDNELAIKHLPPPTHVPGWASFRENVYRFVYERAKLESQVPTEGLRMVTVDELDPYPGSCMGEDLEQHIYRTCVLMGLNYLDVNDHTSFRESMKNNYLARYDAPPKHDPFAWYLGFRQSWEDLMSFLASDEVLASELQAGF